MQRFLGLFLGDYRATGGREEYFVQKKKKG